MVYYANYLRFFERARTEFLRDIGLGVAEFAARGILFVVVHVDITYRSPARYNDLIEILTRVDSCSRATFTMSHVIRLPESDRDIVDGSVRLACINLQGKPLRLPDPWKKRLQEASK